MIRTDTRENTECGDQREAADLATAPTGLPEAGRQLSFQRCRWCGTPAYRRSFCRVCGAMAFDRERSSGMGVVVRRNGNAQHNTWFVAMDEGFNLLCQVTGSSPVVVAVGARVTVVGAVARHGQGLPAVELIHPAPLLERWW